MNSTFNNEEVTFNVHLLMKHPTLVVVIMNFNGEDIIEYEEMIGAPICLGTNSYASENLDLDLKNRATPPARPSTMEPPKESGGINICEEVVQGGHWMIKLMTNCKPSIEYQHRLNPLLQNIFKKEIIKWLNACVVYPIANNKLVRAVQS
ncbi:hypothetical protein H5410_015305 [Solanum commersonii]|uniref:Uncharacterized protein n=1 Tax=Solanum commersonii TaxID=4109 RepID=A0A9J5ZTE6_SOLCO|nr:hypothetical protein H5410_015305 [Solanum commersonii]